jgi:hypothetical protein
VKNYYETVIKKNRSEDFIFYKSGQNKISIFSELYNEKSPPMLFTEIDGIKGERMVDFEIIDHKSLKFQQEETFSPKNYQQNMDGESAKLNKMIIISISTDGFVCPYLIQYQPQSTTRKEDQGAPTVPNTLKRLKSPRLDMI